MIVEGRLEATGKERLDREVGEGLHTRGTRIGGVAAGREALEAEVELTG